MADAGSARPRFCSQCGSPVTVLDAIFCKECGAGLPTIVRNGADVRFEPLIGFALSIIPGLGHWYNGRRKRAVLWCAVVVFFYLFLPESLAVLIHLICAANAAMGGWMREQAPGNRGAHRAF